jgi:hypothetical protein
MPTEVFVKEAREVALLVLAHWAALYAADARVDESVGGVIFTLCDQIDEHPWRRGLPRLPEDVVEDGRMVLRRIGGIFTEVLKGKPETDALREAVRTLRSEHERPRSAGAVSSALNDYLATTAEHWVALEVKAMHLEPLVSRGRGLILELERELTTRGETVRARADTPSPRALAIEQLKEHLRTVRGAAKIAFADTEPALYRAFTSAYERQARRESRVRERHEPPPKRVTLAGAMNARRKRRGRKRSM